MNRIYKHMNAWQTPVALTVEEAIITHIIQEQDCMKLFLTGKRGTLLAILEKNDGENFLDENGITNAEQLKGTPVDAHLDARRVIGISLR